MFLPVVKFVCHGRKVLRIGKEYGWLPGARYTNLRDVREFERLGFLDIDWKNYCFRKHLKAVKSTRPIITVARDLATRSESNQVLDEARELSLYADTVVIVPKDPTLGPDLEDLIPAEFRLGYSVPTGYGKTHIPTHFFKRPVHLLGGRPDIQRMLASRLKIASLDCNRFTFDAAYGDYFDGHYFRPHPVGGYEECIRVSFENINKIWVDPASPYESRAKRIRQDPLQLQFELVA